MALLRSEIRVSCGDFLTAQVAGQITDSFLSSARPTSCKSQNGRLALKLPLDQVSDSELDSLDGDSPFDEIDSLKPRSHLEISPTDSAFHSDDFSPESSRFGGPVSYFSDSVDAPSATPSPEAAIKAVISSLPGGHPFSGNGNQEIQAQPGLCVDSLENFSLRPQPWWESDWSLTEVVPKSYSSVPFVVPILDDLVKPRVGQLNADEVSELSENDSVTSLDLSDSTDSEETESLSFLLGLKCCRVGAGQVARFRCQLLGKRALSVTWHHCNQLVTNGGRYRVHQRGTNHCLEIYFTTFADSGIVSCQAFGQHSSAETRSELRIRESRLQPRPPEFLYELETQEVTAGDDAEFSCKLRGHPVPVLTWFLSGRKVSPMDSGFDVEHIGNEEWLVLIDGKRLLSSTTIRCLASNPLGDCVSTASVLVVSTAPGAQPRQLHRQPGNVDGKLDNLDKKLCYTKGQVLQSAEQMLNDATQMSSLDRQLKFVDAYLDRIEAKFRQVPPATSLEQAVVPPPPPQLSVIEVKFPSHMSRGPLSARSMLKPPDPPRRAQEPIPKPPPNQSLSITVLSRQIQSDKINVVFKQSFDAADLKQHQNEPQKPVEHYHPLRADSYAYREKLKWNSIRPTAQMDDDNPYSKKNLAKRLAESEKMLTAALLLPNAAVAATSTSSSSSSEAEDPEPAEELRRRIDTTGQYNRDYFVNNISSKPVAAVKAQTHATSLQPEVLQRAEEKVNCATDRLHQLDNRIDILHNELHETKYSPEDLKRLESALVFTAAEIQATERTIKQVESLVTRLHTQRQQQQQSDRHCSPQELVHEVLPAPSAFITYANMSSTPQDFPQDGPSVKSLLSRFQHERVKPSENNNHNGHHRRVGSAASDEPSDGSVTSSPDDKDRKPLPVFNKAKFQQGVTAARALPGKPKIHASLTARSLSREMREQLRIARPQMGAFRSNIMTAENGEYDPEKAMKAKELFIAESAYDQEQQNHDRQKNENGNHKNGNGNSTNNRFKLDEQLSENHEDSHSPEALLEVNHGETNSNGDLETHYQQRNGNGSHTYEDSLDEELEHEHESEAEVTTMNGHGRLAADSEQNGEAGHNGHDEYETSSLGNDAHDLQKVTCVPQKKTTFKDDEEGDIPLSQAPDWDLLI